MTSDFGGGYLGPLKVCPLTEILATPLEGELAPPESYARGALGATAHPLEGTGFFRKIFLFCKLGPSQK